MDFPDNIQLAKLHDGTFAANWFDNLQWDYEKDYEWNLQHKSYKYIGIEYGKTEFEVIVKSCLKCHAAQAFDPDNWCSPEDLPRIYLSKSGLTYWARWTHNYTRFATTEKGKTEFDAIGKACLMCYLEISRSPDSRDPSDYTLTINNKEVSIKKICNTLISGKYPCGYVTEAELGKPLVQLGDSYIIINEQQVSIHQICEGTAIYPPNPEPVIPNPKHEGLTVAEIMGEIAWSLFPDDNQ